MHAYTGASLLLAYPRGRTWGEDDCTLLRKHDDAGCRDGRGQPEIDDAGCYFKSCGDILTIM